MSRELPDLVRGLLFTYRVPPTLLCLEITESGFMEDPVFARTVLEQLSGLGIKLSIDDYGTGYSSLSYIMQLPVQELKIDRSFIASMVANADISTIVRSTIELGHNLGLKVLAEGVESIDGWNLLARLGCDDAQGFYMSLPIDAEALMRWIRAHQQPQQRGGSYADSA
jgi:EAL domain-containing protein (putative c-di-GMP-specific phosphodiesterase class I)